MQYRVTGVHPTGLTVARGVGRCPQGSPPALASARGEEVRDPTSMAVPVDRTGTASVAPVMAPPVPCMQKPPRQVGIRFQDRLVAAPEEKVKKPAGLKTRAACARAPCSTAAARAARHGVRGRASLKAAV